MIDKTHDFNEIQVGQWIWTAGGSRWSTNNDKRIREVTRLTRTLIVCDDGDEFDRFRVKNGYNNSTSFRYNHIIGIASEDEVREVGIPLKENRQAEKARRAMVDAMKANLPTGMQAWTGDSATWDIRFEAGGFTDVQVLQIANAIKAVHEKTA